MKTPSSSGFSATTFVRAILLIFAATQSVPAALNEEINDTIVANPYYLIDREASDGDPATNFHGFDTTFDITIENTSAADPARSFIFYRVAYQLMRANDGSPVPVTLNGGGTTGYTNATFQSLDAGVDSKNFQLTGLPIPDAPLDAKETYFIQGQLQKGFFNFPDPVNYFDTTDPQNDDFDASAEAVVFEFNNTASLDLNYNIETVPYGLNWGKTYALSTDPGDNGFRASIGVLAARYDGFDSPVSNLTATVQVDFDLLRASDNSQVPLVNDGIFTQTGNAPSHDGSGRPLPVYFHPTLFGFIFDEQLVPTVQLNSVNETYILQATVRHVENAFGSYETAGTCELPAEQLLHFNGTLNAGPEVVTVNDFENIPSPGTSTATYVNTVVQVAADGGEVSGRPDVTFGNTANLGVRLAVDGTMTLTSGSQLIYLADGSGDDIHCLAGPDFSYNSVSLSTSGFTASGVNYHLPQGLVFFPNHNQNPYLGENRISRATSLTLDSALCPPSDFTFPTSGYSAPALGDEAHPVVFPLDKVADGFVVATDGTITAQTSGSDLPQYIHKAELEYLEVQAANGQLLDPTMADRCSNDLYLRNIVDVSNGIKWTTATDGTARLAEGNMKIDDGNFQSHFPKKATVQHLSSTLAFKDGYFAESAGSILQTPSVEVPYYQTCPGPIAEGCTSGLATVGVDQKPDGEKLYFTGNGGLWGDGEIISNGKLGWGRKSPAANDYTHFTSNFDRGKFYMPGYNLYALSNDLFSSAVYDDDAADLSAASLLLSGVEEDANPVDLYSPGEGGYRDGKGSLPGMTLEVLNTGYNGGSKLAANPTNYNYELLEDQGQGGSKYYIREAGVSGRQVGRDGTYDDKLDLYGFECKISQFQLTFLDNTNEKDGCTSWVDGTINVSGYSNWDQVFTGLTFDCYGQPGEMTPNLSDADDKQLDYWQSTFDLKTLAFLNYEEPDGQCPPVFNGKLAVGAKTYANYVTEPLIGTLVFCKNGNLSTLQNTLDEPEAFGDINSQFRIPSLVKLKGPNKDYNLVTTSKLRFSNPEPTGMTGAQRPATGFVTFAATIDIPYFRDLEVQAITTATNELPNGDSTAPFAITPGWDDGSGDTFFTKANFDPEHAGFPFAEISINDYRNPKLSGIDPDTLHADGHLVVAEQDMFGFIPLSYPLFWDDNTRRFASARTEKENIFVAQMEHKIDWMDAKFTNISFGATYDGLPEIKISNFLNGEIDKASEVISNKIGELPKQAIDTGLDKLDQMLEDSLCAIINPLVDEAAGTEMDPGVIRELYRYLYDLYDNNPTDDYGVFRGKVKDALDNPSALAFNSLPKLKAFRDKICTIAETGNTAIADTASFVDQIEVALEDIIKGIDVITTGIKATQDYEVNINPPTITASDIKGILYRNGSGELEIVDALIDLLLANLVEPAVRDVIQPLLEEGASELNDQLNMLLEDIDPALEQITEVLLTVRGYLVEIHGKVATGGEIVDKFKDFFPSDPLAKEAFLNDLVSPVTTRAWNLFLQVEEGLGIDHLVDAGRQFDEFGDNFFNNFTEEQFVQLVKDELKDAILQSEIVRKAQFLLRQLLYDIADRVTSSLQSVLAEITTVMKTVISDTIGALEDEINPLLGEVSKYMGSGEISGYAEFNGDSLRKLRLDAEMQFEIPEEMALHVYLEILCYTSEDNFVDSGCIEPGEKMVEVRIGAKDVSVEWISECKINLEVKMSLKDFNTADSVPPIPVGVGGTFELADGEIDFQAFKILEFGATMAIGLEECYIGAKARAIFSDYEVAAGIFFGRTCTLEPLIFVDPDIGDVVDPGTTFTGAYVYGEVWLPISQLVLGVPPSCLFRIDAGVGAGAFFFLEGPTYGGKIFLGVSGEALCVVSIKGEIKIILASQAGKLKGAGNGKFTAKVGWCPFCIKFSKSVKLLFNDGSWSIQ
ncbi:hypothetical protein [Roseibacillus persicicus]|uniref:hypothetical protein n=1 Tax=Roseibacillus persicicus TaxID=454148 RepID=UPI00280D17FC|nr:hypothetical protein [Roseibacillus persicicus]MDQ8192114.1 hypothetical protein [Roseibacillus persicicus]